MASLIFFQWEVPIPINNLVLSLSGAFLQQFCFLLLAKAYELDQLKVRNASIYFYFGFYYSS